MAYLLDANVFIQAKNLHYGLDQIGAREQAVRAPNGSALVLRLDGPYALVQQRGRIFGWRRRQDARPFPDVALVGLAYGDDVGWTDAEESGGELARGIGVPAIDCGPVGLRPARSSDTR